MSSVQRNIPSNHEVASTTDEPPLMKVDADPAPPLATATATPTPTMSRTLIQQAAQHIARADFLLIATGAGFSADSGLPTYADVATHPIYQRQSLDYGDLCRNRCLHEDPALFYGFWGTCYNSYQQAHPHKGYGILQKWCRHKEEKIKELNGSGSNGTCRLGAYYHYTSNVDGHFRRTGVPTDRLHEIHGAIDQWLPLVGVADLEKEKHSTENSIFVDIQDHEGRSDASQSSSWISIPDSYTFPVDPTTLRLSPERFLQDIYIFGGGSGSRMNRRIGAAPLSSSSKLELWRPRVLMFDDDFATHTIMGLDQSSDRYQNWESMMEHQMEQSKTLRLVVLEIGCGLRVPSVRRECHDVIHDTAARCLTDAKKVTSADKDDDEQGGRKNLPPRCTWIRINPITEEITDGVSDSDDDACHGSSLISIINVQGRALECLQQIDEYYEKWAKERSQDTDFDSHHVD
jgi:hypothetical protein